MRLRPEPIPTLCSECARDLRLPCSALDSDSWETYARIPELLLGGSPVVKRIGYNMYPLRVLLHEGTCALSRRDAHEPEDLQSLAAAPGERGPR